MIPSVLAQAVRQGIEDFLETTFPVSTPFFDGCLERLLKAEGEVFKGPYLSLQLPFREGLREGEFFPAIPLGFRPYLHQEKAFERLSAPHFRSTVIATGTGSGKTECFLWPILDYCYRHRGEPGIKALLIYPMNAGENYNHRSRNKKRRASVMTSAMIHKAFLALTLVLTVPFNLQAEIIKLPKTGQTTAYAARDDGDLQTGIVWPSPRFTIIYGNGAGPCAEQSSDCDGNASTDAVRDRLTGLMWARDGNRAASAKRWDAGITFSNNLDLCGYSDWRLPNLNELESLINVQEKDTSNYLEARGFTNMQPEKYWTSTSLAMMPDIYAWNIHLTTGIVFFSAKTKKLSMLPVRGKTALPAKIWQTGQTELHVPGDDGDKETGIGPPSPRFSVTFCNAEKACSEQKSDCDGNAATDVVTDNLTGLVWPRHANLKGGPSAWTAALSYANALNLCGSFDWRLPNRKELHSLSDYSQSAAALPSGHPFSGVKAHGGYWSSTTWSIMNSQAWLVGIGEGDIGACPKTDVFYVWPVRTGCFATFGEKFGLEIACLEAGARKWAFTFIYTGVGLRWKITPASIKEVPGKEAACLGLEEDFSMQIPCADFEGTRFSFIFRHTGDGLVWEIDPASIHLVD